MYRDFTSLDPSDEQTFVVYEQRMQENSKKALRLGLISGGIFFVLVTIVVFSHAQPKSRFSEEEGAASQELGEEAPVKKAAPAPAAVPEPTPAAEGDTPTEAAEGDTPTEGADPAGGAEAAAGAAEGGAVEAPTPPKGATKAPPTALTGDK